MAPTWDQLGDAFKDNDKVGQRQHRRSLLPACESQRRGARRLPPLTRPAPADLPPPAGLLPPVLAQVVIASVDCTEQKDVCTKAEVGGWGGAGPWAVALGRGCGRPGMGRALQIGKIIVFHKLCARLKYDTRDP